LSDITLILLAAGSSNRFELDVKKQWLRIDHKPLWLNLADRCEEMKLFSKIIITSSLEDILFMQNYADYTFVEGSTSRQLSLSNALKHVETEHVIVNDVARACITKDFFQNIISYKNSSDCIVPYLKVTDTIVFENKTIDRDKVKRIQTPQLSKTSILKKALQTKEAFTDESSAIAALDEKVDFVEGSPLAHKLTTLDDLKKLPCLQAPSAKTLTGFGIDIHPFEQNKEMFLCGVKIDAGYGFKAHSDGDVAIHALIDALLGAAGMGDIGELYPDTDESYAGADSKVLLEETVNRLRAFGYEIGNVDLTIVAESPKLLPYKAKMRKTLASLLCIKPHLVNIKATTAEKLGFIGRKEGATVHAVANLNYFNWKNI